MMFRKSRSPVLLMAMLLQFIALIACTSQPSKINFRYGNDILRSFENRNSAKFILKAGQRGFLDIDGRQYVFELLRIDTLNNVTIELLHSGELVVLSAQSKKEVQLDGFNGNAAFELSMVVRDAAILFVYIQREENELNEEQKQQVNQLKKRDAEVKAHEQAHMAAGGGIVQGGASYQYTRGPDGKQYAVGGEVKIDLSSGKTPEATIRKMQQVRRAALAPAQPSGADRSVAAQASQIEAQARMELHANDKESLSKSDETSPSDASGSEASPSNSAPVAPGREDGGSRPSPLEQVYLPQHQSQHETLTGRRINLSA